MAMSWREVKDRYVICKDGVYLSLSSDDEIQELRAILDDMELDNPKLRLEDARKTGR